MIRFPRPEVSLANLAFLGGLVSQRIMDLITEFINLVMHVDKYLTQLIQNYGVWTYPILFLIVFCETGLVITPFLPGDSLLFAAGTIAAVGSLDVFGLIIILCAAAIIGDTVNYWIGQRVEPKIFSQENAPFLNKKYLEKTHLFYEKHGGRTIVIARFMPIIRTFAPFVAGIARMNYPRFLLYNILGGLVWVNTFVFLGYFFGNLPLVKENFTLVILGIIFISLLPGIVGYLRERFIKTATQ